MKIPAQVTRTIRAALIGWGIVVGATGCSETPEVSTGIDATQAYWALDLNYRAVNLSTQAPWNTVKLEVMPRTYQGVVIPVDSGVLRFVSSDSNSVGVSADGTLRAKRAAQRIRIVATLQIGPITHTDTAFVSVFALTAPPVLTQFSIHPAAPDSAKTATGIPVELSTQTTLLDAAGDSIRNLVVAYRGGNALIADVTFQGSLTPNIPGQLMVTASTYAFGVTKADTVAYTIGYPLQAFASIGLSTRTEQPSIIVEQGVIVIGVGGTVIFQNSMGDPNTLETLAMVDLIFDDTTNIEIDVDYNTIPDNTTVNVQLPYNTYAARRFTAPGTYTFLDANSTLVGTVRVVDERPSVSAARGTR